MIIALSGNDGSGKTTICKALLGDLQELGLNVIYRHEYDYLFLGWVFKLVGKKIVDKQRMQFLKTSKTMNEQRRNPVTRLWPYAVWLDNFLTQYYYRLFKKKIVILLDRHPYDMYLSFEYLGRSNPLLKKLFLLIPRADVQFILFVDANTAFSRKRETHSYPLSFYGIQLNRYLAFAASNKIQTLSTNATLNQTISIIKQAIPVSFYELCRN